MSSTGVYISVHTSNLANSPFLQPGSAVVELLQVCLFVFLCMCVCVRERKWCVCWGGVQGTMVVLLCGNDDDVLREHGVVHALCASPTSCTHSIHAQATQPHTTHDYHTHNHHTQKNWIWDNLDRSFVIQTEMMGDIHHFAWRARHRNQTLYVNKRDAERFGSWPSLMCDTVGVWSDCVCV